MIRCVPASKWFSTHVHSAAVREDDRLHGKIRFMHSDSMGRVSVCCCVISNVVLYGLYRILKQNMTGGKMGHSEKVLVEKMKARLIGERDRQRRWRSRQKERGLKSVVGLISSTAFEILQQEKRRTGERVSDILERAIVALGKTETNNDKNSVTNNDTCHDAKVQPSSTEGKTDSMADTLLLIEDLRIKQRLPFNEIARRLNESGCNAPAGQDSWDGRQVYGLLKRLNIKDKPADSD